MPRRAWDAPLVGRIAELATLDEALHAVGDGSAAVVLIAGEAGIGKSRLAAEAASRALADGWQVLSGGCLDLSEGSVPYLPLVDALHDLATDVLPTLLTRWVRGEVEESPLSEAVARGRVYAAYLEVLRSASVRCPLALIVEDVHWADRGTRDLLSYLVRGLTAPAPQARVLILLTYRSDEFRRGSPVRRWLGELARRPSVSRVDVTPLDRARWRGSWPRLAPSTHALHRRSSCDLKAIPSTSRNWRRSGRPDSRVCPRWHATQRKFG